MSEIDYKDCLEIERAVQMVRAAKGLNFIARETGMSAQTVRLFCQQGSPVHLRISERSIKKLRQACLELGWL